MVESGPRQRVPIHGNHHLAGRLVPHGDHWALLLATRRSRPLPGNSIRGLGVDSGNTDRLGGNDVGQPVSCATLRALGAAADSREGKSLTTGGGVNTERYDAIVIG